MFVFIRVVWINKDALSLSLSMVLMFQFSAMTKPSCEKLIFGLTVNAFADYTIHTLHNINTKISSYVVVLFEKELLS